MPEYLLSLPLYSYINIGILLGSLALCLLLWLNGASFQLIQAKLSNAPKLPAISRFPGSIFPHPVDEIYTIVFITFFAFMSLPQCLPNTIEITAENAWETAFFTAAMYLPMALRYMALPAAPEKGTRLKHLKWVLMTLGVLYLLNVTLGVAGFDKWIVELTSSPDIQQVAKELANAKDPLTFSALCFSAIIIAPLMEEFAFRGFLYNILRGRAGVIAANICTSLFFAAIHTSLVQTLPLFLFSCAQCFLYEKTGSIKYPILLHMIFNTFATILILFAPN